MNPINMKRNKSRKNAPSPKNSLKKSIGYPKPIIVPTAGDVNSPSDFINPRPAPPPPVILSRPRRIVTATTAMPRIGSMVPAPADFETTALGRESPGRFPPAPTFNEKMVRISRWVDGVVIARSYVAAANESDQELTLGMWLGWDGMEGLRS